tara:strand:- start:9619 stop:10662 length:1044 start_codon:yes stop_codon:yes gene_type:complete
VPALTTIQLFDTHSQYLDTTSSNKEVAFRHALNEIMPRIYKMGYWREMLMEHSQDASKGYVSLPQETDSIVAALIDKNPVPTRSLWHDYKLFGTNDDDKTQVNAFVDDGYAPIYRDLVAGSQYKIQVTTLKAPFNLGSGTGVVTARYRRHSDATTGATALTGTDTVLKSDSYTESPVDLVGDGATLPLGDGHTDITEILSVRWTNVEADHPLRVQGIYQGTAGGSISADSTKDLILTDINTSNGVARYRRFRVGNVDSDSVAHMLLKRRWVDCDSNSDLVHIPSNAILKHALLGKLSEDNADAQRAVYHWGVVKELLEADTDSYRGAAKPTLHIAPNGIGGGMSGMY